MEGLDRAKIKWFLGEGAEEEKNGRKIPRGVGTRGEDTYVLKKIYTGTVARERRKWGAGKGGGGV